MLTINNQPEVKLRYTVGMDEPINSQGAVVVAMLPLAYKLGID